MTRSAIAPKIGAKMPDGTIYAGISPDTGKPMYATPADAPLTMTFNEAAEHAKTANSQKACGHRDWRVPTKAELNVLFNNRAAIGGFNVSGSYPAGWYCSSLPGYERTAWCQRFSDGALVWGVLFRIATAEAADLDDAEGLGHGYRKGEVQAIAASTKTLATAYFATHKDPARLPYDWYNAFVLQGAIQHELPEDYIEQIRSVVSQPDPDPARRARNEGLLQRKD
jgi:hypothetical protein